MAYVEVHYGQWDDDGGTAHQVKLLQEGGSGPSVRIAFLFPTPCTIKRRGGKKIQLDNHIYGSELKFNFFVHDDDIATFDAIFESDYKEWKIEHYYNSVLDWVGWLLPDNHSRGWIKKGDYYPVSLSATDGLAKLKEIEFVNFSTGAQYTDRVSIMTTLKRALEHVGHDLNFRVQLGTNCTNDSLMADTDCSLHKVTVDNGRYSVEKDGRQVNEDCYTLIEKTLKDFNCYLIQEDGLYWIVNPQEKDSFYFTLTWADVTTIVSRTAQDLAVSLSGYKYNGYGEKQKIRPFELVEATFRDRNVQDSLLSNGDFAIASTSEWTNGGDFGYFSADAYAENYELVTQVRVDIDGVPSATPNFYSDAQTISKRGESDQIQVKFKLRCTDIDMDVGFSGPTYYERATVICRLRKGSPTGSILTAGLPITLGQEDSTYTEYIFLFNLSETDDYHIEFLIDGEVVTGSWADFDLIEIRFDDISITALYTDGPDITFDAFYKITNTDSAFNDKFEHEMFFGDSVQDNDIGSFQISGTRTKTWDRFGKTENALIQVLSAQNIIENFGGYKDYLRFKILDPSHTIKAYNLLNTDSKDYQILSHTIIFAKSKKKHIKVEVAEVLNAAVGTSVTQQLLTTIDGKGSSASTVINYSPVSGGVTAHGNLTGLGNFDHPQYEKIHDYKIWYVDNNNGSDSNTGAFGSPFKTPQVAYDARITDAFAGTGVIKIMTSGTYAGLIVTFTNLVTEILGGVGNIFLGGLTVTDVNNQLYITNIFNVGALSINQTGGNNCAIKFTDSSASNALGTVSDFNNTIIEVVGNKASLGFSTSSPDILVEASNDALLVFSGQNTYSSIFNSDGKTQISGNTTITTLGLSRGTLTITSSSTLTIGTFIDNGVAIINQANIVITSLRTSIFSEWANVRNEEITLTQSQIQNLNNTPIDLVAVLGAGIFAEILSVSAKNVFNTAAFATATILQIIYTGGSAIWNTSSSFIQSGSDRYEKLAQTAPSQSPANTKVQITADADATSGNAASTIKVYIRYKIIDTN